MEYVPLMIRLRGMRCLVVGGGQIAFRKAKTLLRYGGRVTVIGPEIGREMNKLQSRGLIRWKQKRFSVTDLLGCRLVVAATDDPKVNRMINTWSGRLHILNNSVDDPKNSNFIFPAIYRLEPMTIAVSTQGKAPALAKRVRDEIAMAYGLDYQPYLEAMIQLRTHVRERETDADRRKTLIEQGLTKDSQSTLLRMPSSIKLEEGE